MLASTVALKQGDAIGLASEEEAYVWCKELCVLCSNEGKSTCA